MAEIIASTYEIIKKIGSGGGGNIFLANHIRLGKKVVLKADKRKITTRQDLLRREVDILKDLSHPYIPKVYDFFTDGETVYTVMDYIEGESLNKPLKRGERFSQSQVVKWGIQLLEALSYLHSPIHGIPPRGFVHSDIKPANLMRTPDQNICLIDFNIALALGEENVIGCSDGYASPEHYGLDFSSSSDTVSLDGETPVMGGEKTGRQGTELLASEHGRNGTVLLSEDQIPCSPSPDAIPDPSTCSTFDQQRKKAIIPDIRSDIYSTGATLYHLLKGQRPAKDAQKVIPLSEKEFSPQIVRIILKAMTPNPDQRYQTADEMLYDLFHLRDNDIRVRRWKRECLAACILCSFLFITGIVSSFIGLKRIQTRESWLKLAEYSKNALAGGDTVSAIDYALQAIPEKECILEPAYIAEAQKALTNALGIYDLSDGYKTHEVIELPAAPLYMAISPDGKTAAIVYAYSVAIVDTDQAKIRTTLQAENSALSEVRFLDDDRIIYAGPKGVTTYDIKRDRELWTGKPATAITIAADKKSVAAIYKDESYVTLYDASNGQVKKVIDLNGRHQWVTVNDSFANPNDNIFALNSDGTLLGISFSDGTVQIYDLTDPEKDIIFFEEDSGYTHFEGGFCQQYFAFSAAGTSSSVFAVIDTVKAEQTGGFEADNAFGVQADESGIYVQIDNILVKLHPVTGDQTPLVTALEKISSFARSDGHTLIATQDSFVFFGNNAGLMSSLKKEYDSELLQIAGGTALIGSRNSPVIRIMQYEGDPEADMISYDPTYIHDETRISEDKKSVMLFRYDGFRLYDISGDLITEVSIPDAEQVYDQQYIRNDGASFLNVIYNDGKVFTYSATDGALLDKKAGERPDPEMYEEFYTDTLRIESPLHGAPIAYDRETNRQIRQLEEDAYLTYVTQIGDHIILQYVTAEGYCYGQLLNEDCEVLADLPYLCDILEDTLVFDYPSGNVRQCHLYPLQELVALGEAYLQESEKRSK